VAIQRFGFSAARMMHSYVRDNADRIFICATAPASFSAASTQPSKIVSANATAGDWTIASGSKGPEMTFAQRTMTIEGSGSATHLVFARASGSTILVVTDCCGATALISGNAITIPSWTLESDFGDAMAATRPVMEHAGLAVLIDHNLIREPINVGATANGDWFSTVNMNVVVSATAGPPGVTQDVAKVRMLNAGSHIWTCSARSALVDQAIYRTQIDIKSGDATAANGDYFGMRTTGMQTVTTTWVNVESWTIDSSNALSADITGPMTGGWYTIRHWASASSGTAQLRLIFSSAASDQSLNGLNTGHFFTNAMIVREF
jgi:hypothetical protein